MLCFCTLSLVKLLCFLYACTVTPGFPFFSTGFRQIASPIAKVSDSLTIRNARYISLRCQRRLQAARLGFLRPLVRAFIKAINVTDAVIGGDDYDSCKVNGDYVTGYFDECEHSGAETAPTPQPAIATTQPPVPMKFSTPAPTLPPDGPTSEPTPAPTHEPATHAPTLWISDDTKPTADPSSDAAFSIFGSSGSHSSSGSVGAPAPAGPSNRAELPPALTWRASPPGPRQETSTQV